MQRTGMVAFLDKCDTKQVGTRNWFTLDLFVTRVKGLTRWIALQMRLPLLKGLYEQAMVDQVGTWKCSSKL